MLALYSFYDSILAGNQQPPGHVGTHQKCRERNKHRQQREVVMPGKIRADNKWRLTRKYDHK